MNRWINCFRILSRETSAAREFPRALTMKPNRLFILAKKTQTTHVFAHAFLLAVAFPLCFGQANQADVHITSRISHGPALDGVDPRYDHAEALKANADLVLVPVTVTDQKDRLIIGLEKPNFDIYDRYERQVISQHLY